MSTTTNANSMMASDKTLNPVVSVSKIATRLTAPTGVLGNCKVGFKRRMTL